jgi:transposase
MGWQGTMRHVKGLRIYNKMVPELRAKYKFIHASCWRDDNRAWLCVEDRDTRKQITIRVNRHTGVVEPLGRWGDPY